MKKIFILSLVIMFFTTACIAEVSDKRLIQVVAEGKVIVVPDTAVINIGVKNEDFNTVLAQKKNYRETDELINYLKEKGISEKNITLTSFSILPIYDDEGEKIIKYVATTQLQAKTKNTQNVAEIVDGAVEQGANVVQGIRFIVGDPEKARQEALEQAISNAKDKAWRIARKLEVELGKVVGVSEGYSPITYERSLRAQSLSVEKIPELPMGEVEITAVVNIIYEIK
ncbi:MAG: SIMPL domain-containing protein [Candidatus Margulisbacteria bacterium]|nr:SIMPL domain-containing protein [Candidatus Margulisiibacteriota bacterium]